MTHDGQKVVQLQRRGSQGPEAGLGGMDGTNMLDGDNSSRLILPVPFSSLPSFPLVRP